VADIVKFAIDNVYERFANVQGGAVALLSDSRLHPKVKQDTTYWSELGAFVDAVSRFTINTYTPAVKLLQKGDYLAANELLGDHEKDVVALQNKMDWLNRRQAMTTGRLLMDATKREPSPSWLKQAATYALWGLGLYFGGKLLLTWYEKRSSRYPSPPRYARR
jgi:hypothetical protein